MTLVLLTDIWLLTDFLPFQRHQDLGHTKISEKSASFESQESTSLVEENRQKQTESSKTVNQSEKVEISACKQVKTSSYETSQTYEETEEYEVEA